MYSKISVIHNGSLQSQLRFFWKNLLALNDVISCTVHFGCVVCSESRYSNVPSCDMDGHFIRKKVCLCLRFQCNRGVPFGGMAASDRHGNKQEAAVWHLQLRQSCTNIHSGGSCQRSSVGLSGASHASQLEYVPKPPS